MNRRIVNLIAEALPAGLTHPGDDHNPPALIPLPGFRATGMTDDQAAEFIGSTAKLLAEALVTLIEQDHEILARADVTQLRQDAAEAPDGIRVITVHEGTPLGPELMQLTIDKTDHATIPTAVMRMLAKRFEAP